MSGPNARDTRAMTCRHKLMPHRWRSIPLGVRIMFMLASALFAISFTMMGVRAQSPSNAVCQPTALPLSGAESRAVNSEPTLNEEGTRAAFWSTANPLETTNIDRSIEIFWADTTALTDTASSPIGQLTDSRGNILGGFNIMPDVVTYISSGNELRSFVVFASDRDYEGLNPDGGFEIFLAQMEPVQRIWQLTNTSRSASLMPSTSDVISSRYLRIAYLSDADSNETRPKANNADRNYEVHTLRVDLSPLDKATPGRPTIGEEIQLTVTDGDTVNDQPVISGDGGKVVWLSNAKSGISVENGFSNADGNMEVFVTTVAQPTKGVQVTKSSQGVNDAPDINENGTRIAFVSTVLNYPANGAFPATSTLGAQSVYLARLTSGMANNSVSGFSRISAGIQSSNLQPQDGHTVTAKEPAISAQGRRVVFAADGCDPSAESCDQAEGVYQIFVVDQELSSASSFSIARVTNELTRTFESPALSGDGQRIAVVTNQEVGIDNPDLSGSEILALECRLARLGANITMETIDASLEENRPDVGDEIAFRIALENTTFADFDGTMVMTNTLPLGVTFVSGSIVSAPAGSQITFNPPVPSPAVRNLTWTVTDLPKLTEAVIEIRARVNTGRAGETLLDLVSLSTTANLESQGITNFDDEESLSFFVTKVDLKASLTASTQTPRETEAYTYTVSVSNATGMDPATNVVLTSTLHELLDQMDFVGVSTTGVASNATFNQATGDLVLPRIDGGQTALVYLQFRPHKKLTTPERAGAGGTQPRTVALTDISSDQEDVAPENDLTNASWTVRVLGTDLQLLSFVASPEVPSADTNVRLALTIRNLGPLINTSGPPTDTIYTDNKAAFAPALVQAEVTLPAGIAVDSSTYPDTGISDGGILSGSKVYWQIPGWQAPLTHTLYITGHVTADPGTLLTATAGNINAYFAAPSLLYMNDPVPANNSTAFLQIQVNTPADVPMPIPGVINEGETIELRVPYTDTDLDDTHVIQVLWGDGAVDESEELTRPEGSATGVYTFTHTYTDDPPGMETSDYPIKISVTDGGGNTANVEATVTVNNILPALTDFELTGAVMELPGPPPLEPIHVVLVGEPITVTAAFTDPGYTSAYGDETFSYIVAWTNDNQYAYGDVTEVYTTTAGSTGFFTSTRTFSAPSAESNSMLYIGDDDDDPAPVQPIRVTVDERPNAVDDYAYLDEGGLIDSVSPLDNDTDNGPTISLSGVYTDATLGLVEDVSLGDGTFTYKATITGLRAGEVITDSVQYEVADSIGLTSTATVYFVVTGVNNLPEIDLDGFDTPEIDTTAAFVEDESPPPLAPNGDIRDTDGDDEIQSLVATLTNPLDGAYESLTATVTSSIDIYWDGSTSSLTLTKANPEDVPDWTVALRTVQYLNNSPAPDETPRVIGFAVSDQDGTGTTAYVTVTVESRDDAPIIALQGTPNAMNEGAAVLVDATATVTDEDTAVWDGGVLTVTVESGSALDKLTVASNPLVTVEGLLVQYNLMDVATIANADTAQIVLTFNSNATNEAVQAVVRQIQYTREPGPYEGNRVISMVAHSTPGGPQSEVSSRTMAITYTNDTPAVAIVPPEVTEDTPKDIGNSITIVDADAGTGDLRMTVEVDHGTLFIAGANPNNASTVVVTDTLAALNAASIMYTPTLDYDGVVTLTVTVNDQGNSPPPAKEGSNSGTFDIEDVHDAPVVDLNGGTVDGLDVAVAYTEGVPVFLVGEAAIITDVDSTNLASLSATFTPLSEGSEFLTVTVGSTGLSATYDPEGILTVTGNSEIANYVTVLKTLRYNNVSDDPGTDIRTVSIVAQDDTLVSSAPAKIEISTSPVNDPPAIGINGIDAGNYYTTTFTEDAGNTLLAGPNFEIADPDSTQLSGAEIEFWAAPDGSAESLLAAGGGGAITVHAYNPTNGILRLSGNATLSEYESVLATVAYTNTDNTPTTDDREFSWVITDTQGAVSDPVTTTLHIVAHNDPPVLTAFVVPSGLQEDTSANISSAINLADVDAGTGQLRLQLSVSWGTLGVSGIGGVANNNTSSVVMTGTLTQINAATITFTPTPNMNGSNQLTATVSDLGNSPPPAATYGPVNADFSVAAVADAPALDLNTGMTQTESLSTTLPVTYTISDAALHATDPDGDAPAQIVYTVMSLPNNGSLMLENTPLVACSSEGPSTFTQADIDSGKVHYRLTTYTAAFTTTFNFTLGNAANCSGATSTFSIRVQP